MAITGEGQAEATPFFEQLDALDLLSAATQKVLADHGHEFAFAESAEHEFDLCIQELSEEHAVLLAEEKSLELALLNVRELLGNSHNHLEHVESSKQKSFGSFISHLHDALSDPPPTRWQDALYLEQVRRGPDRPITNIKILRDFIQDSLRRVSLVAQAELAVTETPGIKIFSLAYCSTGLYGNNFNQENVTAVVAVGKATGEPFVYHPEHAEERQWYAPGGRSPWRPARIGVPVTDIEVYKLNGTPIAPAIDLRELFQLELSKVFLGEKGICLTGWNEEPPKVGLGIGTEGFAKLLDSFRDQAETNGLGPHSSMFLPSDLSPAFEKQLLEG